MTLPTGRGAKPHQRKNKRPPPRPPKRRLRAGPGRCGPGNAASLTRRQIMRIHVASRGTLVMNPGIFSDIEVLKLAAGAGKKTEGKGERPVIKTSSFPLEIGA